MIVDERTYTLQIGAVGKYLKLYEATGMTIQRRILGNLLSFYSTEVGTLNQIVHLWGYESMDDRARRRAALWQDPGWLGFAEQAMKLLIKQENRILIPASFSP